MDEPEAFVARQLAYLIADLASDDEDRRWDAAGDIKDMGPVAASAAPALIKILQDRRATEFNPYVRGMACDALGAIGPEAMDAVPTLIECTAEEPGLVEEARWLRLRAAVAIYRITGDSEIARRVAGELANDPEEWLRRTAVGCLSETLSNPPSPL